MNKTFLPIVLLEGAEGPAAAAAADGAKKGVGSWADAAAGAMMGKGTTTGGGV